MNSTVTVSVRIPLNQAKVIKRAAKAAGIKLATFVRDGAFLYATLRLQPPEPSTTEESSRA